MFIGEYNHNLDEKGRVIMPMKFREELGYTFYITKGLDGCLFVFAENEWKEFSQNLLSSNAKDKNARKVQRFFLSPSTECSLDKQGRVLISPSLREYAKLDKNIVIVGVSKRLEIWSKEKWDEYNTDDTEIEDIMQDMEGLSL
jgi:MraZ protein